jgi:hypothetical protein
LNNSTFKQYYLKSQSQIEEKKDSKDATMQMFRAFHNNKDTSPNHPQIDKMLPSHQLLLQNMFQSSNECLNLQVPSVSMLNNAVGKMQKRVQSRSP